MSDLQIIQNWEMSVGQIFQMASQNIRQALDEVAHWSFDLEIKFKLFWLSRGKLIKILAR